ncbi:MAG TPA: TonB-dependent receptor, partial [Vicinamibacterales bacterium]|nr:TonB-dependent receptor [Vicinamibacterales bacterium]
MRKILVLATLAAMLVAWPAAAQETTGAIEGVVRDPAGGVLPGATVVLSGPTGRLVAVTNEVGEYRFPRLASGRYTITATLEGFEPQTLEVDLTVGITSRNEFTLPLSGVAEEVTVSSKSIAIDTASSSAATNISRERIELIPRGRDFSDVVSQAAGAKDESQAGGISIDGSSGSENRFIIDGIDTTSPQVGTSSVPLRAEFLEEVQVKSAGYAAQFGGSTGGVINVITKSGTSQFRGSVLAQFENRSWGGSERPLLRDSLTDNDASVYINPPKDDEFRIDPGFNVGGPVLPNQVFFFAGYQPGIRNTKRTVNFSNGDVNTFEQDFNVNYGTWNVTYNPGSNLNVKGGATYSDYETKGTLPGQDGRTSLTDPADYTRGTKGWRNTYSGMVDYIPTSNLVISARLGHMRTDSQSTGVNFVPLIHNFSTLSTPDGIAGLPPEYRQSPGYLSDILVGNATARDEYKRNSFSVDATWYVEGAGRHEIKVGYQMEKIYNDVQSGYNADRILYYAGRTYRTSTGQTVSGQYGYFRLLNISTLGDVASRNEALFIQDSWRVNSRLTL